MQLQLEGELMEGRSKLQEVITKALDERTTLYK